LTKFEFANLQKQIFTSVNFVGPGHFSCHEEHHNASQAHQVISSGERQALECIRTLECKISFETLLILALKMFSIIRLVTTCDAKVNQD
jgi:hypothetical protein